MGRWLQVHLVILSALGMAMLSELEQSRQVQFFFVIAAAASILIVDVWKWTAVPPWAANLLALFAMAVCARKFYSGPQFYQLTAVADLLLYLQLILFFQRKTQRIYWVLLVLAMLRVIVAATVEPEAYFGVLLLVCVVVMMSSLTCFYLWREEDRVTAANARAVAISEAPPPASSTLLDNARALVAAPTRLQYLPPPASVRKPHLGSLIWGAMKLSFVTLVFASIFFAVMPRVGGDGWAMSRLSQAFSGFSSEVQLHSVARLQQNPDPVFRLRLENIYTQQPIASDDPIYIQGNVLRFYGRSNGVRYAWRKSDPGVAAHSELTSLPVAPPQEPLVRQHITLDMPMRNTLFAIYPFFRTGSTPSSFRLVDKGNHLQGTAPAGFEYTLLTNAFIDGRQSEFRPIIDSREDPSYHDLTAIEKHLFTGLCAKCDQILKNKPGSTVSRFATINALADHLRDSGEYIYTLDRSDISVPAGVDLIENFVTTSKKGYCQFFASALVMMLRHRQIPCRLVNGYCTNEFNEVGKYYQVRQYHAHVWVEAYLDAAELKKIDPALAQRYRDGVWLRVDPTPPAQLPAFQPQNSSPAADSMNFAQILWRDYVVGLNPQRQQKAIYEPFRSSFFDLVRSFFSIEAWRNWWQNVQQLAGLRELLGGNWFSWRGGLAAMTISAALYALYHIACSLYLYSREKLAQRRARRTTALERSKIEFFDRFESILKKWGWERSAGQTPREFAAEVAPALAQRLAPQWGEQMYSLIDLYYQVRFGDRPLDARRQKEIDEQLDALAKMPVAAQPPA